MVYFALFQSPLSIVQFSANGIPKGGIPVGPVPSSTVATGPGAPCPVQLPLPVALKLCSKVEFEESQLLKPNQGKVCVPA